MHTAVRQPLASAAPYVRRRPGLSWRQGENALLALALGAMVVLPLAEALLRPLHGGIPGSGAFLQNLTLLVGMLGAAVAARENRLLSLSTLQTFLRGRALDVVRWLAAVPTIAVGAMLCLAAAQYVQSEMQAGSNLVRRQWRWTRRPDHRQRQKRQARGFSGRRAWRFQENRSRALRSDGDA